MVVAAEGARCSMVEFLSIESLYKSVDSSFAAAGTVVVVSRKGEEGRTVSG